jgi:hypothetical protein
MAKSGNDSSRNPRGIQPESGRSPCTFRADSMVPVPVPVPGTYVPFSDRKELVQRISAGASRRFSPVLVAVLHELLKRATFATVADVADALKAEAARHRVTYDPKTITDAIAIVARTRPILTPPATPTPPAAGLPHDPPAAEARAILRHLGATVKGLP